MFKVLTVAAAATIVFGCNNAAKKAAAEAAAEQARQDSIAATKKVRETKEKQAMEIMKKLPEDQLLPALEEALEEIKNGGNNERVVL